MLKNIFLINTVTLACTAAFAAASTALLCTLFLSGELWSSSQKLPLLEMMMIQPSYHHPPPPLRAEENADTATTTTTTTREEDWSTRSSQTLSRQRRLGSRMMTSSLTHNDDDIASPRNMQEFLPRPPLQNQQGNKKLSTNHDNVSGSSLSLPSSWPTGVAWLMVRSAK